MNDHEFVRLLEKWTQAIASNDAEAIGSFMTDDWMLITSTGVVDRKSFLGAIEAGALLHETMKVAEILRVQVFSDAAVVSGRGTNNGTFQGEPFRANEWTTDVFTKHDGHWLCSLTQLTPIDPR